MPELPEVETVMRGLDAVLTGEVIRTAETRRDGLRWPFPNGMAAALQGARVEGFRRRGKYMLMRLADRPTLLIHLGMSGRMVARRLGAPPVPSLGRQGAASDARGHNNPPEAHEHVVLETEGGWRVGFVDPRRFGCMDFAPREAEDSHPLLAGMGPEPLEEAFDVAVLEAALAGRRTPIKAALLDQRIVAGLGNIYVCEALFRAEIAPTRLATTVPGPDAARLVPAIKAVLAEAIAAGGSSLRDYVRADGEVGFFQERFDVYDREGQPCRLCPGPDGCPGIARLVQSGRSTFYCPQTQR
ncbi:bifunctional DNA-formamidopyrimidine glycosylase/DNA-(apurinic or apyrimidinic site) lyase [Sabulicella glaciei]|uniref:Formamidopyrimidine-DNA glycosylase n=1 Tax=Sabulicella glaciei TaxID=2984948 RepID=A0ABT3NWF8_9PROT|nr:bifunctional DNA-formamidopyrimidine glycosylase/DNA-(apurinic or apyrimidinic site) lyase [Roseococcus sp. MDT2-1-1]MCW8086507.1 bifunctional DNA-formamidopyrimidine glycosylase/DNA-(apurinic or apyrimidinic site) lyase [Roseococcus sp. MDT2-1-1]